MDSALRPVVSLLLVFVAGCAATEPDPKPTKFCSSAFCASGIGLVGKLISDNEDFVVFGISYKGVDLILYQGSAIRPKLDGEQFESADLRWSVYQDEGAWIADITTGSRWPAYVRVSTDARRYSREQFLEALSAISVKIEKR